MSRGSRWAVLAALYLGWLLVPAAVFGFGRLGDGEAGGPCFGYGSWTWSHPELTSYKSQNQRWPPLSIRCTADGPNGFTDQHTFPGPDTYAAVISLMIAPLVLWPVAKRTAHRAPIIYRTD